ncbi:MAG: hypothetical protein ACRD8U_20710 [Pyrinomonadaceae bacterium]
MAMTLAGTNPGVGANILNLEGEQLKTRTPILAAFVLMSLILTTATARTKPSTPLPEPTESLQLVTNRDAGVQSNQAAFGSGAQAAQAGTFEARIDSFLQQGGYEHKKVKTNSWYANVRGKQLTTIRVIIGAGGNSLAVGAGVVSKQSVPLTSDLLFKMMKLSYDLNYVRICIDPDGDLLVMAQRKDRWLDFQEFKDTVDRVAAAADRAYGGVRPLLTVS